MNTRGAAEARAAAESRPKPEDAALLLPEQAKLLEQLEDTLESLRELGLCTTEVFPSAVETHQGEPGGLVGRKVNQVVDDLVQLEALSAARGLQSVPVPVAVLKNVDKGNNPHTHTRRYLEILSRANQRSNGMLGALQTYRNELVAGLHDHFPDLASLPANTAMPAPRSLAADAPGPLRISLLLRPTGSAGATPSSAVPPPLSPAPPSAAPTPNGVGAPLMPPPP